MEKIAKPRKGKLFEEWYLSRNTYGGLIACYPAAISQLKKTRGCVCYEGRILNSQYDYSRPLWMPFGKCRKLFGHTPKRGELLLVTRQKNGRWKAKKIELAFS